MSGRRLAFVAITIAILGGSAVPTTGSEGPTSITPHPEQDAKLVVYAEGEQSEGFSLNDFADEFERRVPEIGETTPSEIKRVARRIATKFEDEADRRIKISAGFECCPKTLWVKISW